VRRVATTVVATAPKRRTESLRFEPSSGHRARVVSGLSRPRETSARRLRLRWPRFASPTTRGSSQGRIVRRPAAGERAATPGRANGWATFFGAAVRNSAVTNVGRSC